MFKSHYEFDVSAHESWRSPHKVICCEGMAHEDGEGSLRFWLETRHPETLESHPYVEVHGSEMVYSIALVTLIRASQQKGREFHKRDAPWHLRQMVIALARGDVAGKTAGEMLYHVFVFTVAKKAPQWLVEGAPEWWELINPKRGEVSA